jgi:protocatechuate 3,4-dioxygenase beta subunit
VNPRNGIASINRFTHTGTTRMKYSAKSLVGRFLARREVLMLLGTSAGAAVLGACLPGSPFRRAGSRSLLGAATAAEPCVVRPDQTEGPYFVDERLNRSDIRSDPSDGSVKAGVQLAITFIVQRLEGTSCVPLTGALVDLWHCDAAGIYSDVSDPGFNTEGQKFLRGYQLTDINGAVTFSTIYPGWYDGRTVHMHFKVRTDPDVETGFEFTSQLYFDETVTDTVHAQQPYAAKGQRTLRNAGDGIFAGGGDELLLTPSTDGTGGYTASFDIALAVTGTSAGSCTNVDTCLAALQTALPDPAAATSRKARRTSKRLQSLTEKVATRLERAATANTTRQGRLYGKARTKLARLLTASQTADGEGTLDVPLAALETAITALLGQIPA